MEHPRILFISTYPELTSIAKQLSKELDLPMHIKEGGFMKEGHLYAKREEGNFDIIISQGGTAAAINSLIETIPVLSIPITVSDVLKAFAEARSHKKPLALVHYRSEELYDLEEITKLFGIEYKVFSYSDNDEFKQQINRVLDLGEHILIGMGNCIQEIAHSRKLKSVLIKSNEKSIKQTIISANNIIELSNKERFKAERLKNIVNYAREGIISVDKIGSITAFNSVAEKILNINEQTVLNKKISSSSIPKALKLIYGNGDFEINKLVKLHNAIILLNRIPIKINSKHQETILFFQEISDIQKQEYSARMQLHAKGLVAKNTFDNIIGTSKLLKDTISKAVKFGNTSATILIEGETGTGKELFAQGIHNASPRKDGPFVAINCAALPENLLESELFGYEEGAFTGAKKGGKTGLFELAHNGTIFLDEIGEVSLSLQSRLLRVLQEKEVLKIGGNRIFNVNIRVIVATNKNLYNMMLEGKFREDLYFRISILNLKIDPLRKRPDDIPALIEHFIHLQNEKYGTLIKGISKRGMQLLQKYTWPGNVRELEGCMEKLIILAETDIIDEQFIEPILHEHRATQNAPEINDNNSILLNIGSLKDMEMQIMKTLLKKCNGNKKLVAKVLGISRATIWNRFSEVTPKEEENNLTN